MCTFTVSVSRGLIHILQYPEGHLSRLNVFLSGEVFTEMSNIVSLANSVLNNIKSNIDFYILIEGRFTF